MAKNNKTTRIVGLAGPRGSGKNTVYEILRGEAGALEYAFATPLKSAICSVLGVDIAWLEANKDKTVLHNGAVYDMRKLMLDVGDFWRKHDDEVFIHRLIQRILKRVQESPGVPIVVTDVRRPPEAVAIRQIGGEIWHIRRTGTGQGPHDGHEVEQFFDDLLQVGDPIIMNYEDMDSLIDHVRAAWIKN